MIDEVDERMIAVRPASARLSVAADVPVVAALREQALEEQTSFRGGAVYRSREAKPLPAPGADHEPLWVSELGGAVVGYASAHTEELADGRRLGVVDAIYVRPDCRSVGAGEALMQVAVAWCAAEGCLGVDAVALPGDRATKNFFEDSGFVSRLLVMHHSL